MGTAQKFNMARIAAEKEKDSNLVENFIILSNSPY
jgi:hypothetical protein